ncbi:MAG: methyltransferase, partial [Sphaerospermopsis kisseleviana]
MITQAESSQNILAALSLEDMVAGYQLSQTIFALHDLNLADYLHQQGAATASTLALSLSVDITPLTTLLEIATTLDLLQKDEHDRYSLTPTGTRLRLDDADSIIPLLQHHRDGYAAWNALLYTLQTGQAGFRQVYQMDIYQYQGQHPEKLAYFNRYMQQTTTAWLTQVVDYYDFSGHVIDVGGNTGALIALLLQKFPELKGTVFDLEQAVGQAHAVLSAAGVSERCQVITGSFFEAATIPTDGTLYLISRVLLNWTDQRAIEILQNCRAAMPAQSKLLILDFVLSASNTISTMPLLHSLHLGIMFGARTRQRHEFEQLVEAAGFTALRWISINATTFLLECSPQ